MYLAIARKAVFILHIDESAEEAGSLQSLGRAGELKRFFHARHDNLSQA